MTVNTHMTTLMNFFCGTPSNLQKHGPAVTIRALGRRGLGLFSVLSLAWAIMACAPAAGISGAAGDANGGANAATARQCTEIVRIGPQNDFEPACLRRSFSLTNTTAALLPWQVTLSRRWLSMSGPDHGVLAPGDSIAVPVEIDAYAASRDEIDPAVAQVAFQHSGSGALLATHEVRVKSNFEDFENDGWTRFTPSLDTRTVYVSSSSGNDQFDGLSASTPKRTLAAAVSLLRQGFPDWLLLERAGVWHESLGHWIKSGRSASEPMLVSTYGGASARPLLLTGTTAGIWTSGGGGSPATIDNLALLGVHFQADGYIGGGDCIGAELLQPGSHVLIEDCMFEGYSSNVVFQGFGGRHTDFRLRRSVIVDAYTVHTVGGHSQGLYAYGLDGLLVEENVFDHNGWNESVVGAGADVFSHNLYIDNGSTGVVVRGNIIANGSSHGMQLRCGGSVVDNLFVRNSISLLVGGGTDPEPGGVTADVRGNVILDGKNIDNANPRGWGLVLANIKSGRVASNVVANNQLGTQPTIITLDGDAVGNNGPTFGVHGLSIADNIFYNWGGGVLVKGTATKISNLTFDGNDFQNTILPEPLIEHSVANTPAAIHSANNRFFNRVMPLAAWTKIGNSPHSITDWQALVGDTTSDTLKVNYVEPDRSLAEYNVLAGGAFGMSAFLAESRQQSRTSWRQAYTAAQVNRYIRAGY